jgi:hypothetical protein
MPLFSTRRRHSDTLTVRRTRDSAVLPAQRDRAGKKLAQFPSHLQPGYDPKWKKVLMNRKDVLSCHMADFLPEFFAAYWQLLHAISFLPAHRDATEEMLCGVQVFFENLGKHFFPGCSTNSCLKHYREAVEAAESVDGGLRHLVRNQDRFALAKWLNGIHNDVHKRRREDTLHKDIVKRDAVGFETVKAYYMASCGDPFRLPLSECWLYTQFHLNVRKDMCRINNVALHEELYKSFGDKIAKAYKNITPYGIFNQFWRRPPHISDGYVMSITPFCFTVVRSLWLYSYLMLMVTRLLTTHRHVLTNTVTQGTATSLFAILLTMIIIGRAGKLDHSKQT